MEGKIDCQKLFSTCLDDPRCAEMMQKIMDRKGSLSGFEGIMRSMMEKCDCWGKKSKETKEEKSHD